MVDFTVIIIIIIIIIFDILINRLNNFVHTMPDCSLKIIQVSDKFASVPVLEVSYLIFRMGTQKKKRKARNHRHSRI